ncbi:MAG: hypothetical protein H7197_07120 [Vitreoscilla sp.]|nr:hypothetical protein [Polaromonas sp.]
MELYLARDAFESVKLLPTSAPLWQRLCALTDALGIDQKSKLIDDISSLVLPSSDADWLRCGALACLTRNPVWFDRQATLASIETPPDAVMTLLGLAWYHAMARAPESDAFVQLLQGIDAPRLQRLVAAWLPRSSAKSTLISNPPAVPLAQANLRFAIYTPQVVGNAHGGTTLTLNMMSILTRLGLACQVFSAQEANILDANSHSGGIEFLGQVAVEAESLVLNVPGSMQIVLPNVDLSLRLRFEQVLAAIHAYQPDVVIFVGFMSPLVYSLYESYPVVGLSIHALPPIAPVDVWLSADPTGDSALWRDLPAPQMTHYPFRFWPQGKAVPIDRMRWQIPASAVMLITTGSRLDTEMPVWWADRMLAFLEAHQDVHWLLVGIPDGWQHPSLSAHSRIHGNTKQLALEAWLAACDIYINPPRIGGGATVAMAMEQGLAVLSLANSDGGDKLGRWAAASVDAYFDQLSTWVGDSTLRQQVGIALKARFDERLDVSSIQAQDGLIAACRAAMAAFNLRTEGGHVCTFFAGGIKRRQTRGYFWQSTLSQSGLVLFAA